MIQQAVVAEVLNAESPQYPLKDMADVLHCLQQEVQLLRVQGLGRPISWPEGPWDAKVRRGLLSCF